MIESTQANLIVLLNEANSDDQVVSGGKRFCFGKQCLQFVLITCRCLVLADCGQPAPHRRRRVERLSAKRGSLEQHHRANIRAQAGRIDREASSIALIARSLLQVHLQLFAD